jgi:hypothetical protein
VYELYNSAITAMQFDYPAEYTKLVNTYTKRLETLKGEYSINFERYDTEEKIREQVFRG